ncbi:NADH-quinone oxidoreductase subunit M [Candidatus Hecatella orcuttiae]|jgi:NADH-quinone oxidoreductase subunit M|uniref:complex I subunit 4 family protein n=1 Tax=Candidatus Hecatella orcuttiae TaxID=1935119 RepID=UPI002867BAB8|nr:NADH-quinone oxidoreductase subunit M [Candidatus Hecatella orcuttiae]
MGPEQLLIQSVFLPLLVSPLLALLPKRMGKQAGWAAFAVTAYISALLLTLATRIFTGTVEAYVFQVPWAPSLGLTFGFHADGLGVTMALTIALLASIVAPYSIRYMDGEQNMPLYYGLYLLYTAGMLGSVLASDLIEFYLFFELMLLPSWALVHGWGTGDRERVAFRYFIYTHMGALLFLLGILATGAAYGSFSLFAIEEASAQGQPVGSTAARLIVAALLVGLMVKLAIFPFHAWLPDTYVEAPTPITALLSATTSGIGGYAILRIVFTAFPQTILEFSPGLAAMALVTMVYGALMALAQDDIKRLLAYSSISQMGYLLFGLASSSALGLVGAIFLYFSHATSKAALFMISGVLTRQAGTRSIRQLGGLASKMPYTAVAMVVGFLSLSGVPPLNGFQSEWMIFLGFFLHGVVEGGAVRVVLAVAAVMATALTLSYSLWTVRRVLFRQLPSRLSRVKEASNLFIVPLMVLTVLTVATGVYPQFLNQLLSRVMEALVP